MTREESMKILILIQAAYPNYKPADKTATLDTWTIMLTEYTYEQVSMALKAYIQTDTSGFAPAIGQIIDRIQQISRPNDLNEMEAWALVSKALRNGYYGAEQEFSNLPPLIQQAVGCPSNLRHWSQSDLESIETVIQSNFMRSYRVVVQREQEKQKMSVDLQGLIDTVNSGRKPIGLTGGGIVSDADTALPDTVAGVPMPEELKEKLKKELLEN